MPYESRTRNPRVGPKTGPREAEGGVLPDQAEPAVEFLNSTTQDYLRERLAKVEGEAALLRSLLSAVEARDAAAEAVRQEAAKKSPGLGANLEKEQDDRSRPGGGP